MTGEQIENKEGLSPQEKAFLKLLMIEGDLAAVKAYFEQTLTDKEIENAKSKLREERGE
jgi:hypothetical protein